MAMSKPKDEDTFDDKTTLTCSLCQEIYQKPIILPCLHTYCEKCISDFIASIARTKTDERLLEFCCPTCRMPVKILDSEVDVSKWLATLPRNVVMEIMIRLSEGKQQQCETCACNNEISDATVWCADCEEAMCENCIAMHNKMKLLKHHNSVKIDNIGKENAKMYSKAVSTICSCQDAKQVEHFCRDHDDIFCYVCRDSVHKDCRDVCDIRTFIKTDHKFNKFSENLTNLLQAIVILYSRKENEKKELKMAVNNLIEEAKNSVEEIKIKLNSLLETFKKKVCVFQEEEIAKSNMRLRLLQQLNKNVDFWHAASDMVKEKDSDIQGFIFIHSVKKQLKESVREISNLLEPGISSHLTYQQSDLIQELHKSDDIGSFVVTTKYPHYEIDSIYECCESLEMLFDSSFENVEVEFLRTITVDGAKYLRCGECLDQEFIVVGDDCAPYMLHLIEISTGIVVNTVGIGFPRRLCFDKKNNQIFVSCWDKTNFRVGLLDRELRKPEKLVFNNDTVGGMIVNGDDVYVMVNGGVKKFVSSVDPNDAGNTMTTCFATNTDSFRDISTHKENVFFTTKVNDIKCITFSGEDVFCFQDPVVRSPGALSPLPSGLILVLDSYEKGKIHLLSADGRRCRTLLEKFEAVTSPGDIWIDSVGRTLYVCGGKNIDVYRIL